MIIIFHKNNKVNQVYDYSLNLELVIDGVTIQEVLISTATKNNNRFIGWCHDSLKKVINLSQWSVIFKHNLIMASFEISNSYYIIPEIGYVDSTPSINVSKRKIYPTWLMSSDVGGIHGSSLLKFTYLLKYKISFDFFINTIAKVGMKQGLLCYSNPNLLKSLKGKYEINKKSISDSGLIWFIKSNFGFRWAFLFLLNVLLYQKRFLIVSFLKSISKKVITNNITFKDIQLSAKKEICNSTIDVLIPTLGREKYLKNVLLDLSIQTKLPKKVIIIEQNPNENETSELYFLNETWPFEIDHTLTHQLGACNARNVGLSKTTSEWVFFADDDIRFKSTLLEDSLKYLNLYQTNAISISCLQKNEIEKKNIIFQSSHFGSGTSIVNSKSLDNVKFDLSYEFGYGEDMDFGMQLRNTGTDILYVPFVYMRHLKAPVGGFRNIVKRKWDLDTIPPKPSPTIMVFKIKHSTKEQIQSYQTMLFLTFYRNQPIKNPISYFKIMKKAWGRSKYWANYLIKKYSKDEI